MCVCVECKCRAVAVWCSQAAPDVPQQSTVQKLFISPSKAQLNHSVYEKRTDPHMTPYMPTHMHRDTHLSKVHA